MKVDLLRQKLSTKHPELEIKSVDGFQGREKEAVVLSLVRSNRKGDFIRSVAVVLDKCQLASCLVGEVGFLAEDRRINVAVTRGRRHVAVVCDTQTVQNHAFLKSLISHMTEFGEVRTAFEYIQDIVPQNYVRDPKSNSAASRSMTTKQKVKDQPPRMAKPTQKKSADVSSKRQDKHSSALTEEEQKENRRADIRQQLEMFLKDPSLNQRQFPSSFNSHDRLLVHELAEELGLVHESKGEGKDRHITVSKHPRSGPAEPAEAQQEEGPAAREQERVPEDPPRQLPLDLRRLHLERMQREQQKRDENAQRKKQQSAATRAQSSKKSSAAKGRSDKTSGAGRGRMSTFICPLILTPSRKNPNQSRCL